MPDGSTNSGRLRSVPVEIKVSVGHARPTISALLDLTKDDVLPLDRRIEDPVELYIGERLVAIGELVQTEDAGTSQLGVRVLEMVDSSDG